MTPLLVIWYAAGLYAIALVALDVRRAVRSGQQSWRRALVTTAIPVVVGGAVFAIWPLVAWALARSP